MGVFGVGDFSGRHVVSVGGGMIAFPQFGESFRAWWSWILGFHWG